MTLIAKEDNLLLTGFAIIFFSGFLLANSILIGASFIPLFIYFIKLFITPPEVQIKKIGLPSSARLGEIIEVNIAGKITGGPGAVVICDEVPELFQLVEGSNYRVVSKEFKEKEFSFSYKFRCTKCGTYRLGIGWETRHILGLTQTRVSIDDGRELRVLPISPKIRKMKLPMRTTQRIHPSEGIAKIGPMSTDFKEIRNYFYGDPFKIINWKASARAAGRGKLYPLVNEYEREGKLSIWLFLDASPDLRVGTQFENALEYGILAAYSISYHFLNKGYSLGMYVYNHQGKTIYSDTGKKQFIKIANNLLRLTPPKVGLHVFWDEGFSKAVERNRKYLITQSPGIVIITHVTSSNCSDLLNGVRRILVYRKGRRQPDILVVNILPYNLVPKVNDWEVFAARMLDVASRSFSNRLRNLGVKMLDWDPRKESMEMTLLNTIRLR
ncbi:MAG: DUF58 domain-containing protein [Candidatus Bathyarchaeia archaeon]